MKKKVRVSDYLEDISYVFNPVLNYEGAYAFLTDLFYDTSKVSNGVNLAQKYFKDNYIGKILDLFPGMKFNQDFRLFLSSDLGENGYGRKLKVSASLLVMDICNSIVGDGFIPSEDLDELKKQVSEFSRKYRKAIAEILKGTFNPENEDIYNGLRIVYEQREQIRKMKYGKNYIFYDYRSFLEKVREMLVSFSFGIKGIDKVVDREIDLYQLSECLDLDKFFLAMSKQLIEISKFSISQEKAIHNSFLFVDTYANLIKSLIEEHGYDEKVTFTLVTGEVVTTTAREVLREYNEMRLQNPSYVVSLIENTDGEDFRDINRAKELSRQMQDIIDSKELQASWEFVRNGHLSDEDKKDRTVSGESSSPKKSHISIDRDILIQNTNDRVAFLDSSPYLYRMNGRNNFDGYIGYVYENGYVIFEKFYQREGSLEPASNHATYVMSFANFVEMSKKTKTEIINYIKNGEHDLKRIYHTKTWRDKIEQVISGRTYNQEAIDKIERLIADKVIFKTKK